MKTIDMQTARGYAAIGLHKPKTPSNIGSVLRAAGNFNVSLVAAAGRRYSKSPTDTMAAYKHFPLIEVDDLKTVIPYDCIPVAVDLVEKARNIVNYVHPERAFYIFGPEDGTLGKEVISWCRDVIYVPTKQCMNLAGCVHVVLYDRLLKQARR